MISIKYIMIYRSTTRVAYIINLLLLWLGRVSTQRVRFNSLDIRVPWCTTQYEASEEKLSEKNK